MIYSAHAQRVELHYGTQCDRSILPHLAQGVAIKMGHGRGPHNVLVRLDDGRVMVVPCGNVMEIKR